jgi:tRNA (adenine-N(1)-)-methyltransferase non-catalytic subunit
VPPGAGGSNSEVPSRSGTPVNDATAMEVDSEEASAAEQPAVVEHLHGKRGTKKIKGKGKEKEPVIDVSEVKLMPLRAPRMEELGEPDMNVHYRIRSSHQLVCCPVTEETDATNELIDDNPDLVTSTQSALLSSEEIADLRNQGFTAEDIIQMQIERHDRFGLKTEFSKDKWKKRKEKR